MRVLLRAAHPEAADTTADGRHSRSTCPPAKPTHAPTDRPRWTRIELRWEGTMNRATGRAAITAALVVIGSLAAIGSTEERTGGPSAGSGGGSQTGSRSQAGSGGSTGNNDKVDDVSIARCSTSSVFGWAEASLRVTNNSSRTSSYIIDVGFESPSGSILHGTGTALVNGLEPGQSTTVDAMSTADVSGEFTCRVRNVNRWASF